MNTKKQKKYSLGLEETSENIITHTDIIKYENNPNITLTSVDIYQSNYNYSEIANNFERTELYKYEVIIVDNLKHLKRNFKEVCEKLYNAQQLLANHDKTNGMFYKWFGSMKLEKNVVYRCIERYKVFLESQKDIYLSQDVPIRAIQLVKRLNTDIKIKVGDLLTNKEISTTLDLQNYLISHVGQDNKVEKNTETYKTKSLKISRSDDKMVIKLNIKLSDSAYTKLREFILKLINE